MNAISPEVLAGAALLDERVPDWVERIDLEKLRLSDCFRCVLGQVFREDYDLAVDQAGIPPEDPYNLGIEMLEVENTETQLGFDIPVADSESFAALTAQWRNLILQRRSGQ